MRQKSIFSIIFSLSLFLLVFFAGLVTSDWQLLVINSTVDTLTFLTITFSLLGLLWIIYLFYQFNQQLQTQIHSCLQTEQNLRLQETERIQELAEKNRQLQQQMQEREQITKALRFSEERFELAMRGANDGLWDWNLETNEAYFSPRWKHILGFADYELSNHFDEWHKRLHPDEFDTVMLGIDAYLEKKTPTYESLHRMKHKEEYYVWILVRGIAVWNAQGEATRFVGTHVDMTVQKQAEQALRESEQYRRMLVEESLIGLVLIDLQGGIKEINPAYAQITGYTTEELSQQSVWELTPKEYHGHLAEQLTLVQQQTRFGPVEKKYQHKAGQLIPIRWSGLLLKIKAQTFVWCCVDDITEQKRAEQAEIAKLEAEMANQAKSTFLANVSHELRTPLNGILGYAQILARDRQLTAKQREGIHIIQQSGEYLLNLINDILDISRLDTGQITLHPIDFNFQQFLEELNAVFETRATQKGLTFGYEPLTQLPLGVQADEKRLRQIFTNLLSNAIKFTHKGGVIFKVGHYEKNQLFFQVEDTGVGMTAQQIERIFLPFQQANTHSVYNKTEGIGLGLPITRSLIEMMQGTLQITSIPKHGSTFTLTLHLQETEGLILPEHQEGIITGYQGERRTLLIVDDKWENRSVLVSLLNPLGFQLLEANHGQEALTLLEHNFVDLILTDLVMPVMDGFELTRRLRNLPHPDSNPLTHLPIIAISASVFESEQAATLAIGCTYFLAKPLRVKALLDVLARTLSLNWIYEQPNLDPPSRPESLSQNIRTLEDVFANLIGPSSEQADQLYQLVLTEELADVITRVEQFEQQNPQLTPFANQIRQWAKEFKEELICRIIELYL